MKTRALQPNSTSGLMVSMLKEIGPLDTADIARRFGLSSQAASSFLCQLHKRGRITKESEGKPGRFATPVKWAVKGGGR